MLEEHPSFFYPQGSR